MRKRFLLLIFIISFILFFSCTKHEESKIEGLWKKVDVTNVTNSSFTYWQFSNGYLYILESKAGSPYFDTSAYGEYIVKATLFKKSFTITKCTSTILMGRWTIDKLNKKSLTFERNNPGIEYYEFTKQ